MKNKYHNPSKGKYHYIYIKAESKNIYACLLKYTPNIKRKKTQPIYLEDLEFFKLKLNNSSHVFLNPVKKMSLKKSVFDDFFVL